jgi:UDP-glucose 4-epimerase
MGESYIFDAALDPLADAPRRRVAITGAAGRIGTSLTAYLRDRHELRLLVATTDDTDELTDCGEVCCGDINDSAYLDRAFAGIDTVVHLAADPSPRATWESLLPNNINGTRQVFAAAAAAGCRRVIFASSIHAVSGYHPRHQVHPDDPVNPGDLYGVSKCFGEALARYYAEQRDLSAICIRIGWFASRDQAAEAESLANLNAFVSHRDLDQLIARAIADERLTFAIVHGLSANPFNRLDTHTAEELLGYRPQDDFGELNRRLADLELRRQVRPHSESEQAEN